MNKGLFQTIIKETVKNLKKRILKIKEMFEREFKNNFSLIDDYFKILLEEVTQQIEESKT